MCSSNDRKAFITVRVEAKNLSSEGCPRKNAEILFFFDFLYLSYMIKGLESLEIKWFIF